MDIQAAKTLFATTFGKRTVAAPEKTITAISAVSPTRNFASQTQPGSTCYVLKRSAQPCGETLDVKPPKSRPAPSLPPHAIVVEHQSDRYSRAYLNVADANTTTHQIDTFA